ncbi:hypothetical protein [Labrys monachus]|uniref:hypothetical protein n=1 Tax=Labrys monachus TaxID=217067 RepID=UPI0027D8B97F|nr:hypothetical protein [Labrys monachus]
MVGRQFGVWAARGALLAGLAALGGCSNSIITGVYGTPTEAESSSTPSTPSAPTRVDFDPDAECPVINVPNGASFYTSGGAQMTISKFARECDLSGPASVTIKIGIKGLAILKQGGAGTYSAPLRITIRDRDEHTAYTKVLRVAASVPPGEDQGSFEVVDTSTPIVIGVQQPLNSYDIQIGFDNKGALEPPTKKKHRR